MNRYDVRALQFTPGTDAQECDGLLGFLRFECGPFLVDSVQLRRTRAGQMTLRFPSRVSPGGVEYPLIRPATGWERDRMTASIVSELRRRKELPE